MVRLIVLALSLAAAGSAQVNVTSVPDTLPGGLAGYPYSSSSPQNCLVATSPQRLFGSGGFPPFTLAVSAGALPPGVTMSPEGLFSGTTTTAGSYAFTVRTTDDRGNTGTVDYAIDVAPAPVFACTPTKGSVGDTFTMPLNCGGPFTFGYTIEGGALPPGLSLDGSTGTISGVPTQPGLYSFDWRCTIQEDPGTYTTLTIQAAIGPAPRVSYSGAVGVPFDQTYAFGTGTAPFSYEVSGGGLPPGVSLAGGQPRLSGTPSTAGSYTFDLVRTDADGATARVQVTIVVAQFAPPALSAKPSSLSLAASPSDANGLRTAFAVSSSVSAEYQATASTESGGNWLSVTPASGNFAAAQTQTFQINADSASLAPGAYIGRVAIQAGGESVAVPVTLLKTRTEQQLQITQTGVTIRLQQGSRALTRTFFNVANSGSGSIDWTANASTVSGGDWLQPTRTSGNTADSSSSDQQGVVINAAGLQPGAYYGFVDVSSAGAANSPQRATVVLDVRPRNEAVTPLVQPQGAALVGAEGQSSEILRFFRVTNTSADDLEFSVTSAAEDGGDWLPSGEGAVLPTGGAPVDLTPGERISIPAGDSVQFAPLVRTQGLAQGVYRGRVSLFFNNSTSVDLRLALVITPAGAALTAEGTKDQAGACTPNQTVPVVTELGGGGPPSSGWAQPISVQAVDDCGNPVNNGSATTTYSGVSSPQTPLTNLDGTWSGTWTPPPTGDDTDVEVTVTVTDAEGNTGESSDTVTVEANELAPPIVAEGGVVQAASFAREPLALGSIVSLFGSDLSPMTVDSGGVGASALPLSTELGNTRITLGGEALPLLFVREDQINAILPFELGDRAADDLPLVVERTDNRALSTAQKIAVSGARPGIFTQTGAGTGPGSILDGNFALVSDDNPTAAGEAIVVFATGLGPTDPPVATGDAAPGQEPLARATQEIRVTVAGVDAQVLFAGLSPGFAGLFQVNIIVPDGVEAGDAELIVYSGGQPSQTATVAVR